MKIEIRDNTRGSHLIISDISDRLYISPDVWVSTSYGVIKVGIEGGNTYKAIDNKLVEILKPRNTPNCAS